mmetsp:Transcript_5347/g.10981  ORF Transcript_5347/g.10981 Transcript_5347/m.10981 type:complete len:208 (-) Transcript_5347:50-673(-)
MLLQVALMIFISWSEVFEWPHQCGYFVVVVRSNGAGVQHELQLRAHLFDNLVLLLVATKDETRVLETNIISLAILSGRIVELKEESNKFFKVLFRLVQFDHENFDMSRAAGADLLVGGIFDPNIIRGTHKSDSGTFDALWELFLKVLSHKFFGPPIAASAKGKRGRESCLGFRRRRCRTRRRVGAHDAFEKCHFVVSVCFFVCLLLL